MTVESVYCALCEERVALDDDHIRIEAEHLPRTEFANVDEFAAHPECWSELTDDWMAPA